MTGSMPIGTRSNCICSAKSLQGISRVLAVSGHFAVTRRYAKQLQALDVKVYVDEPKANCVTFHTALDFARENQLFAGSVATILPVILTWMFAKASNNRAEMKAIKDSLDKAIAELAGYNRELIPALLGTVDKLAESLRPAMREAVAPIGKTCTHLTIGSVPPIDEAKAHAIRSPVADDVTDERSWDVLITEMDYESRSAKVRFMDMDEEGQDDRRVKAIITDPAFGVIENLYMRAFAAQTELRVRGKALLKEGEIQMLYVSNTDIT
jgi:hypothetical protein